METFIIVIYILFAIFGLITGFILVINPILVIELQRRFYEKINWNLEPISLSKAISYFRKTGFLLIVLFVIILFLIFFDKNIVF